MPRTLFWTVARMAAMAGLCLGIALTPATAGAAPAAPTGLTASGSPTPTLTWTAQPGATKYRIQGSENSSFSPLVFNQETTANSYTPTRILRSGTLYWQVQAIDATGGSGWTQSSTVIEALTTPANVQVSPGQQVLPPVSPPIISWDAVPGATSYDVEMDAEGDGLGGTVKDVKTTTYVWPEPQGVGERQGTEDYFVRVRAKFDNGLQSEWTAYTSYDVAQLPPVTSSSCGAKLVCAPDPSDGVRPRVEVQDVVFDWDPVKGAKEYEIWVALDPDFNTQIEKRKVVSTRYSPTTTYDNNSYYWKVRAYNAGGEPTPWPASPSVFDRRWPFKPSLVYPPVASSPPVGDDVYYQWTPVRHATRYELVVSEDANFTKDHPTTETCYTLSTTYTPGFANDRCTPPQGRTFYWKVRALDGPADVNGVFSENGQFVYDSGRIQPISPANGSTVVVPTFRWQPSPEANAYRITLTGAGQVVTATTSALSWTPTELLPSDSNAVDPERNPDLFTWEITAIDGDGRTSPTYTGGSVYVAESPIAGGAAPLTPLPLASGQITSRFPALAWQPWASTVDQPVYYKLRISETPGYMLSEGTTAILAKKLAYPAVTDLSTYFLNPGTRTWWIEAFDATTNVSLGSGPSSTFTIEAPDAAAGHQVALDGLSVDQGQTCAKRLVVVDGVTDEETVCTGMSATPILDWESVPGAGGYQVYVAEDPDFTNWVYEGVQTINSRFTPAENHTPKALPDNESGPAYYWYIRPCARVLPTVNCGPDPSGQIDSGASAFRKVSPRISLESPDVPTVGDQLTFRWTDYHLTNQATAPVYGGSIPPYQTAFRYRLQVAQSATITDTNTIDDVTVDQATYTAFTKTYPEGDLWWRVQAIDGNNNRLAWSETRKVVKATPAANLDPNTNVSPERALVDPAARPAFNSHESTGSTLFRWSAEDFDATWELQVYKNDDSVPSSGNLIFTTVTKQAAFVPAIPLPPSSEPYRWRVKRTDVGGKAGRWSDMGRFYVDPLPVSLISPTDQAAVQPNGAMFGWATYGQAAVRASKYTIDIEPLTSGASNPSPTTTTATVWSSPTNLANGSYTWAVKALDVAGKEIGTSPVWSFAVDAGLRAITPTQIAAPDGSAVGKTLTSTPPVWNQPDVQVAYQWLRSGSAITGATAATYMLTTADYAKVITLRITGTKPAYVNGVSVSNDVSVSAGGALQATVAPQLTGSAASGSVVKVSNGTWSPVANKFRYQWLRAGVPIPGATSASYRVTVDDAGRDLSATVFASASGFEEGASTSAAISVARLSSTTAGALKSTRVPVGKRARLTVTVTVPGLATPAGTVQVLDKGKKIASFTMAPVHKGKKTLKLRKLAKGKHRLQIFYLGNAQVLGSKSKKIILYIVK